MRIVALQTLRPEFQSNVCVLVLHTDEGIVGLGETFMGAEAVEAHLHESVAPLLIGLTDPAPEAVAGLITPYVGFQGGGVETRAAGAVDFALWDLLGKRTGLPVARLLGGPVRERMRTYNTCAGTGYISDTSRQESANWGLAEGELEDLSAFLNEPARLARDLRSEGLTGMKVWPFDPAAETTGGNEVRGADLLPGLRVLDAIRSEVGTDLDLMVELHGLWNRPSAIKVLRAIEEFSPYWAEDPVRPDAVAALAAVRQETSVPIATGETAIGRRAFDELLRTARIDFATCDVQWTGGITEARKITALADAHGVPVAPHDCTGPISLAAATHVTMSQPNAVLQETVRAFLRTWYPRIVTGVPEVIDGHVHLSDRPGLGVELSEELLTSSAVVSRVSGTIS